MKNKKRGFTIIELLLVTAIISIVASIVLVMLSSSKMRARDARRILEIEQITKALELYRADKGYYPEPAPSTQGCNWDENCYASSNDPTSWNELTATLAPYINGGPLPVDPINTSGCLTYNTFACYAYSYGKVYRNSHPAQYDLFMNLEFPGNALRCEVKGYHYDWTKWPWCAPLASVPNACSGGPCTVYPGSLYEASDD